MIFNTTEYKEIDRFTKENAPTLGWQISGNSFLKSGNKFIFGFDYAYSSFTAYPYSATSAIQSLSISLIPKIRKLYLPVNFGITPKTDRTDRVFRSLSVGIGLRTSNFSYLLNYATLTKVVFYPGDMYYNYTYNHFSSLKFGLNYLRDFGRFSPYLTLGIYPIYLQGEFRKDIDGVLIPFSKFIFGYHLGAGLKISFIRLEAGLLLRPLFENKRFPLRISVNN